MVRRVIAKVEERWGQKRMLYRRRKRWLWSWRWRWGGGEGGSKSRHGRGMQATRERRKTWMCPVQPSDSYFTDEIMETPLIVSGFSCNPGPLGQGLRLSHGGWDKGINVLWKPCKCHANECDLALAGQPRIFYPLLSLSSDPAGNFVSGPATDLLGKFTQIPNLCKGDKNSSYLLRLL